MRAPHVLLSGVVLVRARGGVQRHNSQLLPRIARLLEARGGSLCVMAGSTPIPFELPASVDLRRSGVPAAPALARALREGRALRGLLAGARADGRPFDLVHTGHLPVPRSLPVPFTLTLHHLKTADQLHEPAWRRLLGVRSARVAVQRARRTIVVSEAVRDELVRRFAVDPERVCIVPNAADHLPVLERAPGANAPLLHVGDLTPRKNIGLLLRALALDTELPGLVLAGDGSPAELRRIRALAVELGVADRLDLRGAVDDDELARLYATAACVVFPSHCEGFGIPALEARRAGVPLAVSQLESLLEIAGAETPSFRPDDAGGCARAIRAALSTSAAELEAAARSARRFTWDASAARWVELLSEAAGSAR